jgi:hypothetical protein
LRTGFPLSLPAVELVVPDWYSFGALTLLPLTGSPAIAKFRVVNTYDSRPFDLIDDDKDVPAVDHIPIAALPVPVTVPVRVPVGVVPVSVSVYSSGAGGSSDSGRAGSGMIGAIGASHGRAASGMNCRAITGLHCRATSTMCDLPVFPLIGIRV